jgi:hypothetical protein
MNEDVGTRVLIVGDHPWTGECGKVLAIEAIRFALAARVELDVGGECFAEAKHLKIISRKSR